MSWRGTRLAIQNCLTSASSFTGAVLAQQQNLQARLDVMLV
jgi:hypothetical protein